MIATVIRSNSERSISADCLLMLGPGWLVLCKWIDGDKCDGTSPIEQVYSIGLEGIVSKRKDSRYISGRSPCWLKMKNPASEAARRQAGEELTRQIVPSVESPSTTAVPNPHE
jgi:hypothetical protein